MKFKLVIDKTGEEEVLATVHAPSDLTAQIEELILGYGGADKISVCTEEGMLLLPFQNIECIMVRDGKTYAVDREGKQYRIRMRLYEVEKRLPAYFIRIHKSALANETRIVRFKASFSGAVDVVFQSGYTEYVSRRCFAEIKRRFDSK